MKKSNSFLAIPPGATIEEQLVEKGMSREVFAARMAMSVEDVDSLIKGDARLTDDVAKRLELVLGPSASFWRNLESIYREKLQMAETDND